MTTARSDLIVVPSARALVDPRPTGDVRYDEVMALIDRILGVQEKILMFLKREHPEAFGEEHDT